MSDTKTKRTAPQHTGPLPRLAPIAHMMDLFAAEPKTALCGERIQGIDATNSEHQKCVVCLELSGENLEESQ